MDRNIHLILLLSGLCSLSSCVPRHNYVLVNAPKTWHEAQSYCQEKYLDLATTDDMSEMKTALKAVENEEDQAVWIGLQREERLRWHWSLVDEDFYKEGERNYFNWGSVTTGDCVSYKKGKLHTKECRKVKQYPICFDGNKHGREQYVIATKKLYWPASRDYCRTNHTDLTSVRNEEERQKIQDIAGDQSVWVGLFRDPFKWSDQTDSSFRYWKAGDLKPIRDPENCIALLTSKSGKWGALPCDEPHPFLCNSAATFLSSSFVKVRISAHDLDLNGPAVQEYILKQIKQKLSNNNVTDVSLRWRKQPDGIVFTKEPNKGG